MLTADHLEARIKDGALVLRKLDAKARVEAERLAQAYLDDAHAHIGKLREELDEAWGAHDAGSRGKLAAGLQKLVEDRCAFDEDESVDPIALRRELFQRACRARREHGRLDRDAVLAEAATALGLESDRVERMLFADRRGENVLRAAPSVSARTIVEAYETGRTQAVLLKAVKVTCDVRSASPALVRAFFAKLKFNQLLFTIARVDERTLRVVVDGPFSMFDSVTRYGLKLAMIVPALRELDEWTLEAEVRWGKARTPVVYRESDSGERRQHGSGDRGQTETEGVGDELRGCFVEARRRGWGCRVASEVLATDDGRVVVPDLVMEKDGNRVYVEMLGFWSRDAVWRRIEMAEKGLRDLRERVPCESHGLGAAVVFCANARLRVSEEVLDGDAHAALYVYKTKVLGPALLDRVERVAYPPAPCTSSSPEHPAASEKPSPAST